MQETHQRVQTATDTGAKTRALAVNIPLKEQYGIIETLRPDESEGYEVNYTEPGYSFSPTPGYDYAILSPLSQSYKSALSNADLTAKQTLITTLSDSLGQNEAGDEIAKIEPENICIQVLPLPAGDSITKRDKLDFSCEVTTPNGDPLEISAENVEVYGYKHNLNNAEHLRVYNVVFVGVAYEDRHFFYNLFQRLTHGDDESNWSDPPIRTTYSIAYPQIDACTADEC